MSWTSLPVSNPIDVILIHNTKIYTGSYNITEGDIQMLDYDLNILSSIPTSGTFDLKTSSSSLYAATSTSVLRLDFDLNIIGQFDTPFLNTFLCIHNSLLYVCNSQGSVDVYSLELEFLYSFEVSSDILWVCHVIGDTLLCVGEEPCLFYVSLDDKKVNKVTRKNFDMGIISIFSMGDVLLVGSYDEHVYSIEGDITTKHFIGGGVWRIKEYGGRYYMTCMYEGVKVVDKDLKKIYNHYKMSEFSDKAVSDVSVNELSDTLIYAMDICEDFFILSTFYGKKLFKLNLHNLNKEEDTI